MKKIFSLLLILALITPFSLLSTVALAASPDYNVHINTPVIATNPLSISGTTTSAKYVGQESQHVVVINWGDGSPNTSMPIPLGSFNTSAKTFSWNWGPISHPYTNSTTQSFKIIVNVCHQGCTGAEGSGDSTDTSIVVIPPQVPPVSITNSPVIYNGSPQAVAVSSTVPGVISNIKYNGILTVPTNVGTYPITVNFVPTDTGTYSTLTNASVGDFVINKADTVTTVTCPSSVTYNGLPRIPCSATVTGPGGLSLTPTPAYSNNVNVGTAGASYSYSGGSNYNVSNDSKNFSIDKANAIILITGYSGVYDGVAHGATGSAIGVLSEALSGLDLGSLFTNVPGGTANWTFTGGSNYNDQNGSAAIDITKANQTITFVVGSHTFGNPDFDISATASSGLSPVTFSKVSGNCDLSGSTVHITGTGDCTITANQAGDGNYNPAPEVSRTFNIDKADQTITFGPLADKTYGDGDFVVSATASSGLAVTFGASGNCSISSSTVHITGAGSCSIVASQSGNDNYNPASDVSQSFTINKADAICSVDGYTGVYDGLAHGAVGSCTGVDSAILDGLDLGNSFTNVPGGTASWTFTGGSNYNDQNGSVSIDITKASQAITFDPLGDKIASDDDFDVNATSDSGLTVTFTVGDEDSCTISGNTVQITGIGTCTVTANQAGDGNYDPAQEVVQSFAIVALTHTITASTGTNGTISPLGAVTVADGQDKVFTITANSGYHISGLIVDGSSVGTATSYSFNNVTADHTISVSFAQDIVSSGGGRVGGGRPVVSVAPTNEGEVLGAESSCGIYIEKFLRRGYKNDPQAVMKVQLFMNDYLNAGLKEDGIFGSNTERFVKKFQSQHSDKILKPWKLKLPTGIFYLTTQTEVNNIMCPELNLPIPTLVPLEVNPLAPQKV